MQLPISFLSFKSEKYSKPEVFGFFVISLLLIIFLIARAILVPMTHDEIGTFIQYVQTGDFWPFIHKSDGNNHLLNTIFTYFFYHVLGSTPLVLRLSNLLFAPLYFYFCFKISEQLQSKLLGWVFFLTMALTLHLIEFLALSRGYGLAITFCAGALWQFTIGVRNSSLRNFYLSFLFIFLSSCAILTLSYTYLLILAYVFIFFVFNSKKVKISGWLKFACFGVLPVLFLIAFSLYVKANGAYFDGNSFGLWQTTFKTFFMPLGDLGFETINFYMITLITILLIPILIFLFVFVRQGKQTLTYHLIIPYLLFGNLLITFLSVKILSLVYPGDRMSFYLFPLIVGSIVFLVDMVVMLTGVKVLAILMIPLFYFPVHFFKAANLEYSVWYKYCHVPHRFYDRVMEDCEIGDIPPSVSAHGLQSNAWMFFIRDNDKKASLISKEPRPNHHTKYQMIELHYFNDWQNYFDTIDYDPISNMHLLKKRTELEKKIFASVQNINTKGIMNTEAESIYEGSVDKIRDKTVEIDFDLSVQSYQSLICGGFTISIIDSIGKDLYWDSFFLNWVGEKWDGKPHNYLNSIVLDIPKDASKLYVRFWNIKKRDYSINGGEINISILEEKSIADKATQ